MQPTYWLWLAIAAGLLVLAALPMIRKRREEVFVE